MKLTFLGIGAGVPTKERNAISMILILVGIRSVSDYLIAGKGHNIVF